MQNGKSNRRLVLGGFALALILAAVLWIFAGGDPAAKQPGEAYGEQFFTTMHNAALQSAEVVVPIVMELVNPRSVIDIGCARGDWLRTFQDHGVERVFGLDGAYLDTATLVIPRESFRAVDLNTDRRLDGDFDVAVCLEVGEHLKPEAAEPLVDRLTQSAPVVLFSAAVPLQGGTDHINEQWPEYWRKIFDSKGFIMTDPIRDQVRSDDRVSWYYRQNMLVYVARDALSSYPALEAAVVPREASGLEWVHSNVVRKYAADQETRSYKVFASLRQMARDLRYFLTPD